MNINIFLGEDSKYYINQFRENMIKWAQNNNVFVTIKISNYLSYDLIKDLSTYDICFLDIMIKPNNGIEFAKMIRQYNKDLEIVFLTSYKDFALQGYEVDAHYYILKPIEYTELTKCMNGLIRKINMKYQKKLIFKSDSSLYCYNANEVIYVEANLHSTIIRTLQQEIQTGIAFGKVNECLEYPLFYQIHRSYTVNLMHVLSINGGMVITDIKVNIPISKKKIQEFKRALFEFNEKQLFE